MNPDKDRRFYFDIARSYIDSHEKYVHGKIYNYTELLKLISSLLPVINIDICNIILDYWSSWILKNVYSFHIPKIVSNNIKFISVTKTIRSSGCDYSLGSNTYSKSPSDSLINNCFPGLYSYIMLYDDKIASVTFTQKNYECIHIDILYVPKGPSIPMAYVSF